MSSPLVSVFMPAYNQVEFVGEALQSAIEQDYPNLQVVAVDDGSIDGTADIISDYARKYPDRVTAIVGLPHLGLTRNCNRTLQACSGQYVAFHAGDDLFLPGKISKQVEWMEQDDRRVLCGHEVEVFDSITGRTLYVQRPHIRKGYGASAFVRCGAFVYGQSIMLRSSAMPPSGFDERLPVSSDVKFWIDCLAKSRGEFGCLAGVYSRYRRHGRNVTDLRVDHILDHLQSLDIIQESYPELGEDCQYRRSYLQYIVGLWHLSKLETKMARSYFALALEEKAWLSWQLPFFWVLSFMPIPALAAAQQLRRTLVVG